METVDKTNVLEHLPMSECLKIILEDNEWSGVVLYYLLHKRLKSLLYAIYRKYAQLLVDQFDDLIGNFFIYLRDGGKEKNETPYAMLRTIKNDNSFKWWLLGTFKIYLANSTSVRERVRWKTVDENEQRLLVYAVDYREMERKISIAAHVIAYIHQTRSSKMKLITMYMLMRVINRRSMPQSKDVAAMLDTSAVAVRARECQIRRSMDKCRDRLLRGELLKLDEDHQIMKKRIDKSFGKNLEETIYHYYRLEVWKMTGVILPTLINGY